MKQTLIRALVLFFALSIVSCGYRFVDPSPGEGYALTQIRNTTPEPGLDRMLAEELRDMGSFDPKAENRLTVMITRFEEIVEAVSSGGVIVREKLRLEVQWKVQGPGDSRATFGKETVNKSYPYSNDPATLDWNRSGAIRLLVNSAAERVLNGIEELP